MWQITDNLANIVFERKPDYFPKKYVKIFVNPEIYYQYVGTYRSDEYDKTFVVTKEYGKLIGMLSGGGKMQLYPKAENEFFAILDQRFSFIKNEEGIVSKVILC